MYVAAVANSWQRRLGEVEMFSPDWDAFRDQCRQAGKSKSAVLLLRYGPGGFNALHRHLRGRDFFPIQMAAILSRRADQHSAGFQGGEFVLSDVPQGQDRRKPLKVVD